MAFSSNEVEESAAHQTDPPASDSPVPMEDDEVEHDQRSLIDEDEQPSPTPSPEPAANDDESLSPTEHSAARRTLSKTRSVSFAPMVEEYEIPARSSLSSDCSADFLDALVESYKLQTAATLVPEPEDRKYVPRTNHTRVNPNWREHRIRRLMNKLEELTLWDREEELKASQAQCLRAQKLEQIQDRQRNNDLCLHLMRQRHESEMESAVLLDPEANRSNKESMHATIARTMSLPTTSDVLECEPAKRREKPLLLRTPIGRYRQFENNMTTKMDKINQSFRRDWRNTRAYSPFYASIPPTVVPLFSETYASLLSIPDAYSASKYGSRQLSPHDYSPDYETRVRAHSNRDVRVPLKEHSSDESDDDEENANGQPRHSRSSFSPTRRSTRSISSTASSLYDCSLLQSRQAMASNTPRRSRNDDAHAVVYFAARPPPSNESTSKTRSSSIPVNKRLALDDNVDVAGSFAYSRSTRERYQPTMMPLSSPH